MSSFGKTTIMPTSEPRGGDRLTAASLVALDSALAQSSNAVVVPRSKMSPASSVSTLSGAAVLEESIEPGPEKLKQIFAVVDSADRASRYIENEDIREVKFLDRRGKTPLIFLYTESDSDVVVKAGSKREAEDDVTGRILLPAVNPTPNNHSVRVPLQDLPAAAHNANQQTSQRQVTAVQDNHSASKKRRLANGSVELRREPENQNREPSSIGGSRDMRHNVRKTELRALVRKHVGPGRMEPEGELDDEARSKLMAAYYRQEKAAILNKINKEADKYRAQCTHDVDEEMHARRTVLKIEIEQEGETSRNNMRPRIERELREELWAKVKKSAPQQRRGQHAAERLNAEEQENRERTTLRAEIRNAARLMAAPNQNFMSGDSNERQQTTPRDSSSGAGGSNIVGNTSGRKRAHTEGVAAPQVLQSIDQNKRARRTTQAEITLDNDVVVLVNMASGGEATDSHRGQQIRLDEPETADSYDLNNADCLFEVAETQPSRSNYIYEDVMEIENAREWVDTQSLFGSEYSSDEYDGEEEEEL